MTRRSRAREVALQLLFQLDFNQALDHAEIERFANARQSDPQSVEFSLRLFNGVRGNLTAIDERLAAAAENWRLPRMAGVDRGALRIGAFELLYTPETPPSVAIDEAIELARRFGAADSPSFVNGVLDRLRKDGEEKTTETPPAE